MIQEDAVFKLLQKKINNKQTHIATNTDISKYEYYKQGFNRFGTQKWMLIERKKADAKGNQEAISIRRKKYYQANKEKINASAKVYYESNKEAMSVQHKVYYEENIEKLKQYSKAFREQNKVRLSIESKKRYAADPEKYIALTKAYTKVHPELVRAGNLKATRKYKTSTKGRASRYNRERDLDYVELFPIFGDVIPHHINNFFVVPVPKDVHQHLSGYSRKKHRELVMEWIYQNNFEMYTTCQFVINGDNRK